MLHVTNSKISDVSPGHPSPGQVLPDMSYIGMGGPKGYGFSVVLVINRVWFLYSSLDMDVFLSRKTTFSLLHIEKTINKSPSQIMFTVINIGLN